TDNCAAISSKRRPLLLPPLRVFHCPASALLSQIRLFRFCQTRRISSPQSHPFNGQSRNFATRSVHEELRHRLFLLKSNPPLRSESSLGRALQLLPVNGWLAKRLPFLILRKLWCWCAAKGSPSYWLAARKSAAWFMRCSNSLIAFDLPKSRSKICER